MGKNSNKFRYMAFPHNSTIKYDPSYFIAITSKNPIDVGNKSQLDWLAREVRKYCKFEVDYIWDVVEINEDNEHLFLSGDLSKWSLFSKAELAPVFIGNRKVA